MITAMAKSRERRSSKVPHSTRPDIRGAAHVVLRIRRGLPSLRTPRCYRVLERCFRRGKQKQGFGLVEFSVQHDHIHMIVDALSRSQLARALQGLMIRIAKALNRFWHRRAGSVFADRYFSLALLKRPQTWRTLRYVLNNARKHGSWTVKDQPDPFSSGRWFLRWTNREGIRRPLRRAPVERSRFIQPLCFPSIEIDDMPGPRHYEPAESIDTLLAAV